MHRIDGSGNVGGMFTDGSPPLTPATVVTADWMNAVQEEIIAILTAAGITLDKPDNTQLLASLTALYGRLASANTWTDTQNFQADVTVSGTAVLIASNGQPTGIRGVGQSIGDSGLLGTGQATGGTGVVGVGGSSGGVGVTGTGGSSASGVEGTGGSNGDGVRGSGTGTGYGGRFTGGGTSGVGVSAQGGTNGAGIVATGGTGAEGIHGIGPTNNYGVRGSSTTGIGIYGESTSASTTAAGVSGFSNNSGPGVEGSSAAGPGGRFSRSVNRGSINLVPAAGDPAALQNGDMWYDSTANAVKLYINGAVKTITVT